MSIQPALFSATSGAVSAVSMADEAKARGAVFTRDAVVDFMLDLAGYTADQDLCALRLLEPSFGGGRFVSAAAKRLVEAWRVGGRVGGDSVLDPAIRAVEVDRSTFETFRAELTALLLAEGLPELSAQRIARSWLVNEDFLDGGLDGQFDVVVGNPPYVRQENLDSVLLSRYRASYSTMVGRADLYVAFFERSLGLLAQGGRLCFICSDAWTKNDYGRELRRLVSNRFALRSYVDMYGVDAFESEVGAYTSVTVISRGEQGAVLAARAESADAVHLRELERQFAGAVSVAREAQVVSVVHPGQGSGPWLLRGDRHVDAIGELERRCETLEQAGCRVGIGVATGADGVFVRPFAELNVEESRRLPLAVNKDVVRGELSWTGRGVLNPWASSGGLVDLAAYPRLAAALEPHREQLARRHTARRDAGRLWYKTIDRITPSLTWEPKLLVPDIRGDGDSIAYDPGGLYPHHNIYFITAAEWDLRALQAVLRSGIAKLFVEAYAVRIGGGYLRFQAQYLRRIRVPAWTTLTPADRLLLSEAGAAGAKVGSTALERIYGLDRGSLDFMEGEGPK
ncbi:MAG: Eco57I restriction-modification methylase domain-containing protein [Propionibacteriaceae bacterium]|jgi:hypothetical protein|nr:Eco57I restriction-modification methylase domain-containing protein [Propionibacteriaceae bacterium]